MWDVTSFKSSDTSFPLISTHTSRVGCDVNTYNVASICTVNFYSHIPCGMWLIHRRIGKSHWHFYSHIPCGMWRWVYLHSRNGWISTHTSRVGCDATYWQVGDTFVKISTHTSRVGCDSFSRHGHAGTSRFLLTHPVWDVTLLSLSPRFASRFLLTHPVWDVTILWGSREWRSIYFYSHIPCGMWPSSILFCFNSDFHFYSHIPCGMWR